MRNNQVYSIFGVCLISCLILRVRHRIHHPSLLRIQGNNSIYSVCILTLSMRTHILSILRQCFHQGISVVQNHPTSHAAQAQHRLSGYPLSHLSQNTLQSTSIPAADAATVKHGRWEKRGQEIYCSECGGESGHTWAGASRYSDEEYSNLEAEEEQWQK